MHFNHKRRFGRLSAFAWVVFATFAAIGSTLTWIGPKSGGNWETTSNWRSSDGRHEWTENNDYDLSSLDSGATISATSPNSVKFCISSLKLPSTENATWTLSGDVNIRIVTKLMPITVPRGSTLNLDVPANNPWSNLPENGYTLLGGGALRHTKLWAQWSSPTIVVSNGTVVVSGKAGSSITTGFAYTTFELAGDNAMLKLETDTMVANVTCPSNSVAVIDLNGHSLRRNFKGVKVADWPGRIIGGGKFVCEGGTAMMLAHAPESVLTMEVHNSDVSIGGAAPSGLPAGSSVDMFANGVLHLGADQSLANLSGDSPLGSVDIAAGRTLSLDGSADMKYDARLTGDGGLVKNGAGTLTLSGHNDYSGATRVNGGKLVVGKGGKIDRSSLYGYANLWDFNVSVTDDSIGGNPLCRKSEWGSYHYPMPDWSPDGHAGGCIHFTYETAPNTHRRLMTSKATAISGTNSFSIGVWIRPVFTNAASAVLFCGKYTEVEAAKRLFQVNISSRSIRHQAVTWAQQRIELSRGCLDDGQWHHICITENANERRSYVDGELLDIAPGPFDIVSGPLSIGGMDNWNSDFEGEMDDIFIVPRVLSAEEVRQIVETNADEEQPLPSPVAHWSFDSNFTDDISGIKLVSGVGIISGAQSSPTIVSSPGAIGKCLDLTANKACLTLPANAAFPSVLPTGRSPFSISLRSYMRKQDDILALFSIGDLSVKNHGFWVGGYSYPARNACGTSANKDWEVLYGLEDTTLASARESAETSFYGWSHIVVTYDGTTLRFYRDGRPIGVQKNNANIDIAPQDLILGCLKPSNIYSSGLIDDLGIYDRALSASEVHDLAEELALGGCDQSVLPPCSAMTLSAGSELVINGGAHAIGSLTGAGNVRLEGETRLDVKGELAIAGDLSGNGITTADKIAISGNATNFHGTLVSRCDKPPKDISEVTLPEPPAGASWNIAWFDGKLKAFTSRPSGAKKLQSPDPSVGYVWGTKDGNLASLGLGGLGLSSHFVNSSWKGVSGTCSYYGINPDGSRSYVYNTGEFITETNANKEVTTREIIVDGRLTREQKDEATVRAVWTFTPRERVGTYHLELQTFLSIPEYQGGKVLLGSNAKALPLDQAKDEIATVSSLSFQNSEQKTTFTFSFPDAKRKVSIGRPSSWDVATMSFSIYCADYYPLGMLEKDKPYAITVDISSSRPVRLVEDPTTIIEKNEEWIPFETLHFPKLGSPLDFTNQRGTTGRAGNLGRVIRDGDHFTFENAPTNRPRFYGNNLDLTVDSPTGEDAANFARNLAAFGYNAMRVWIQNGIAWDHTGDPALLTLNEAGMDKVDWLLAKFFENGIYVTLDLSCDRTNTWRSVGVDRDGNVGSDAVFLLSGIHDGIRANYLAWVKKFFSHRNKYTGLTYAEEPALIGFNILNESNNALVKAPTAYSADYRPIAQAAWSQYVDRKKLEDPITYAALTYELPKSLSESPNGPAYMQMMAEGERRLAADTIRMFREELNCPIPISNLNGGSFNLPLMIAKDAYDYDDMHRYVDHPSFIEESWRQPARAGNSNKNFIKSSFVGKIYCTRLIDRPFTISEDNLCAPWCNASASGLAIGAISALQNSSAIYRFNWGDHPNTYATPEVEQPTSFFTLMGNPQMAISERVAIALFSRGDLPALKKRYVYNVDPVQAALPTSDNVNSPYSYFSLDWAAWHAQVGLAVSNAAPSEAISAGAYPDVMRKTQPAGCAELGIDSPLSPETLDGGSTVQANQVDGSLFVSTPRTAAGYAESGVITAGPLVTDIGDIPATVWVSSLDNAPIALSSRMLFCHLTEVQANGRRFSDPSKNTIFSWGSNPSLMRAGRAVTRLNLGPGNFHVFALDCEGSRRYEVPSETDDGVLSFTADIAADPECATYFYEIVRVQNGMVIFVK